MFDWNFFKRTSSISATVITTIPLGLDASYRLLGTSEGHERIAGGSRLAKVVKLQEQDYVSLQNGQTLESANVIEQAAADIPPTRYRRQHFLLQEEVPLAFGFKTTIYISGALTWDVQALSTEPLAAPIHALYESRTTTGIPVSVRKLRVFETMQGEELQTRVTEHIEIRFPSLLRFIIEPIALKDHR